MIDLHCHILPGIDDGPDKLEKSLQMALQAAEDGIQHIAVTPHIHPGRYDNQAENIRISMENLQQALKDGNIPLTLSIGAEVRISTEMLTLIPEQKIPFIGTWNGQNVILLEFPHSHILPGTEQLIKWLKSQNILPMIAHPERNKEIMDTPAKVEKFVQEGCLIQLTAMSVAGKFGEAAQKCSEYILSKNWATVLATDSHNSNHRPPVLSEGLIAAAEIIGDKHAEELVTDNPAKILGLARF